MLAQLKYHFKDISISELPEEEVLSLWQDLIFVRTEERKATEAKQQEEAANYE